MFEPTNKFEEALLKSFQDPSFTAEFLHTLLGSEIFFIIDANNPNLSERAFLAGDNVSIQHIEFEGIRWLPIFSSLKFLLEFTKRNCIYGRLVVKDFFFMCKGAHIILNPNLEKAWRFPPEFVTVLLDGSYFRPKTIRIEKPTPIQVRIPPFPPHELIKSLSELFSRNNDVIAGYLLECYDPEKNEPAHPLIGLEVIRDYNKILGDAGVVTQRITQNKYFVDFTQVKKGDSGVKGFMVEKIKPFYKKN